MCLFFKIFIDFSVKFWVEKGPGLGLFLEILSMVFWNSYE
jgi:hypothetical protein